MNQTLKCVDCGTDFNFGDKDQAFYQEMGFTPPKRCKPCRLKKKQGRNNNEDRGY